MSSSTLWTSKEDEFLRDNYRNLTAEQLAEQIGRTEGAVRHRLSKLGLVDKRAPAWSPKEDELLRDNYHNLTAEQLADQIGRTPNAIYCHLGYLRKKEK